MKQRKPILDPAHPMFAKAWVRWACTLTPLAGGGFELWMGDPLWAILFGAAGVYAGYTLIYKR